MAVRCSASNHVSLSSKINTMPSVLAHSSGAQMPEGMANSSDSHATVALATQNYLVITSWLDTVSNCYLHGSFTTSYFSVGLSWYGRSPATVMLRDLPHMQTLPLHPRSSSPPTVCFCTVIACWIKLRGLPCPGIMVIGNSKWIFHFALITDTSIVHSSTISKLNTVI